MLYILYLSYVLIVFAEKERLSDGPVSPKGTDKTGENYSRSSVENFARNLDTNKDGYIDFDELRDWVHNSYLLADNKEAEERLHEYDVNSDGFVTWKEYIIDSFPEDESQYSADDKQLMEQDKMYFDMADIDKDGKLDFNELRAFVSPENYDHMKDTIVKATLMEKDLNGDNAIDINEYLGEMADQKNNEWYNIEKERFYTEYDTNKDGKLTGIEIKNWLVPGSDILGSHEATHLLSNADDDNDGKLSYDEVAKHHDLFAKSDAANDGDYHPYVHEEL